jgi:peptide/nickel transport system ATP-binding protein
MSLLRIEGLSVRYKDHAAISDLSLTVEPGQMVGLVGESGSGKSTAAMATIGLLSPAATQIGEIIVDGRALSGLDRRQMDALRGGLVGMIFQEPMTALNPMMRIGAQVAETIRIHKRVSRREAMKAAVAVMTRVGLDPAKIPADRYPHQLSGGQRQRVAIAIAIAAGPKLLIADEPTTALDVTTQAHIMALLRELVVQENMGLLLVSHDLGLIAETADTLVVMKDGRCVESGPAQDVMNRPTHAYTQMLLGKARYAPVRPPVVAVEGPPLLEVEAIVRTYPGQWAGFRRAPGKRAVDDVSFVVRRGETVGLVGESGSGKSTLLRTVLGLDAPQAGAVRLHGETLSGAKGLTLRRLRRNVQAVFQDPYGSFDPRYTVEHIVAEPLFLLDDKPGGKERRRLVEAALEQVGLNATHVDRYPHEFSGGQRQRLAIARALIVQPDLVVLDEAVSALDVSIRADILDLLAELSARLGLAYLFVSHDLSVMRAVTDRLLVMHDGRIVEQGATADVIAAPSHPYTASLLAATPDLERALAGKA